MSAKLRDEVVDWVRRYVKITETPLSRIISWIGISRDKFYDWSRRYGAENKHNGLIPRNFWLEDWEKQAILDFHADHQENGYRRITFMMLDRDIVAVSPSTTYRVLKNAGLVRCWNTKESKKGDGFDPHTRPHEHWYVDVSYISATFYYFCGVLDGYSRYIVHWEIREAMTEKGSFQNRVGSKTSD